MKELQADVVVLSAGTGGLPAAVTAAEGGASVIVFEKRASTGGTGNMANGIFAVESRLQRIKEYPLTKEEAFKIWMDFCHWRVNARLVKTFIDKSAGTIDWLEGLGVEFSVLTVAHGLGNYYTWHVVKNAPGTSDEHGRAATMMNILAEKAGELGAQIFLKTPARRLLKEDGRITGVVAEDASGEEVRARAKAVIISTGGIGSGSQSVFGQGDGVRMAREVGAAVKIPPSSEEKGTPVIGVGGTSGGPGMHSHVMVCFQQGGLMVNLLGERFMNEEITLNSPFGPSAIGLQKDCCAITIFDEEAKDHYVEYLDHVPGIVAEWQSLTEASNFDTEIKELLGKGSDYIFMAGSIEELADKLGVNADTLRETIEEYNIACDTGRDRLFNKNPKWLRPVRKPPFYAHKDKYRGGQIEYGGIKINHKTEVLTEDFTVIPGLYAIGMDAACNIYYDIYPNVLPATAMGFPVISGRMAGENALDYIKSIRE